MSYKSLSVYNDFIVLIQERRIFPKPVQHVIDSLTTKVEDLESETTTLESKNTTLEKKNQELTIENNNLREQLYLALHRHYRRSSEKDDSSQLELFGEAEDSSEDTENTEDKEEDEIVVPSYRRKKSGRKPIDPSIPREDVLHDIPQEEKSCGCGAELTRISEDVSEEIEIIPEQVLVKRHIYPRYACRVCEGSGDEDKPVFRSAIREPRLLAGSIASPSALAVILTNKFTDHLPFYRQEKRFERIGIHISRQDMSNWTMQAHKKLSALEELMVRKIRQGPVIQMDETRVQVMKEPGRANTKNSYMWPARGGPPDTPLVYYHYHPGRDSRFAEDFLRDYTGFLQTDGYSAYETALRGNVGNIIHVGCLAHVRRKFFEASKVLKKTGGAQVLR